MEPYPNLMRHSLTEPYLNNLLLKFKNCSRIKEITYWLLIGLNISPLFDMETTESVPAPHYSSLQSANGSGSSIFTLALLIRRSPPISDMQNCPKNRNMKLCRTPGARPEETT
jgi:hypothetical protein